MPEEVIKILREGQYQIDTSNFVVSAPKIFKKTKEQEIDESSKRIEDLRNEIRELEADINKKIEKAETDAEEIVEKAEMEAQRVVEQAEKSAFERVQKSLDEKEEVVEEKTHELQKILEDAKQEAAKIIDDAQKRALNIEEEARRDGFEKGHQEGFHFAEQEVEHMVKRLHSIVRATIDERERILVHSEKQIINLVLSMVRKIVKRLTQEENDMVINNTKAALELIRGAMKVYIRVNPDDYDYTMKHKEELINMIEGMPEVKFFEDPSIGKGGVYIETDIGEVDATIASQLEEIENKLNYYAPIKVKPNAITPSTPPEPEPDELNEMDAVDSNTFESSTIPNDEQLKGQMKQTEEEPIGPPPRKPEYTRQKPKEETPSSESDQDKVQEFLDKGFSDEQPGEEPETEISIPKNPLEEG